MGYLPEGVPKLAPRQRPKPSKFLSRVKTNGHTERLVSFASGRLVGLNKPAKCKPAVTSYCTQELLVLLKGRILGLHLSSVTYGDDHGPNTSRTAISHNVLDSGCILLYRTDHCGLALMMAVYTAMIQRKSRCSTSSWNDWTHCQEVTHH